MSITRSQIARQLYANGGYSDFASPSSTTASQDFATQAVSGGQTNYDGGGGSYDYIPQPTVAKLNTDPIKGGDNIPAWVKHAHTTLAMRGLNKPAIPNYGYQSGADFQLNFPNLDPRVTAVLASTYQLGQEGLRSLNPFGNNFLDFKGAFNTAQESAAKNIEGALAADLNVLSPEEIASGREYAESVGINNNVYINKARGGRVNYARGGNTGYSDYASPSSSTASQDFATQAVSGGQTDYGGGGDNQPISTPRVNPVVNAIQTAGNYAKKGINYMSQRPMSVMSILSGFNPVTMGLMYLANKFGGPRSTGNNPNASPSMSTANQPYSVMRTGGTFDVPYTGGDNEILPRLPVVAETPTDVNETISDFDLYMRNLRTAQPSPFMLDPRFSAADGGLASLRQNYKLGKLVKKATNAVKKVVKSDIGKAALTAATLYGGAKFLGSPTGTGFKKFLFGVAPGLDGPPASPTAFLGKEGFLNRLGLTKKAGSMALSGRGYAGLGILGASTLAGLSAADDDDEETLDEISSRKDISGLKELIAKYPALRFQVPKDYQLVAQGGRIGYQDAGSVNSNDQDLFERFIEEREKYFRNQDKENLLRDFEQFKRDQEPTMAAQGGRIGYEMGGDIDPADLPMSKEGFPRYEDESGEEVPYPYDNQEMASDPDPMAELFQMYLEAIKSGQIPRSTTFEEYKQLRNEMSSRSMEPQMLAYGGRIGYEEGGLMNLGGMEKDYRAEGGFVPIGGKEKADDVPARLSRNEFVFTADAVRNAGEGDIDKGAEVMENVMNHLEAGGTVSGESQGLAGARKMFQTSQRLGEVL
jgi:hypothetical protein